MYSPVKDGIEKAVQSVRYTEARSPADLGELVHCFWELKTTAPLADDFYLHVLPDACVNVLFNMVDTDIAAITALQTKYEVLNLGRSFHYVGIQLLPGVWRGDRDEIFDRFVDSPYAGTLPLVETAEALARLDFADQHPVLAVLVRRLATEGLVLPNDITVKILTHLDVVHSVADMAAVTGRSARQLQRVLKRTTGFSPHDFLKVVRLQRSFGRDYLTSYTDQSHFIHSFRALTGYTPAAYYKRFDV
ncbi:AraC family transcriptional regulator [Streptomyces caniscabiei]|uniref:AraC family transcriptional regulator n=1 Tax=Streptomyces caniscabiei TaxID=2746961 RepID=UPI0029A4BFAD|nr:AraC family transcriptional regulator [Streptomyces caniscabiei]MDX2775792.1 AraC family transcriptional regulator [Streptomyces caniscabiei]